jgi:hypothetical protein
VAVKRNARPALVTPNPFSFYPSWPRHQRQKQRRIDGDPGWNRVDLPRAILVDAEKVGRMRALEENMAANLKSQIR